jgi:hypothetical protein
MRIYSPVRLDSGPNGELFSGLVSMLIAATRYGAVENRNVTPATCDELFATKRRWVANNWRQ